MNINIEDKLEETVNSFLKEGFIDLIKKELQLLISEQIKKIIKYSDEVSWLETEIRSVARKIIKERISEKLETSVMLTDCEKRITSEDFIKNQIINLFGPYLKEYKTVLKEENEKAIKELFERQNRFLSKKYMILEEDKVEEEYETY